MKIESLLHGICYPLKWVPIVKRMYCNDLREPCMYEHVITGLLVSAMTRNLIVWFIGVFLHVLVKEVILDASKRNSQIEKDMFISNLIERSYGWLLGLPFVFF